MSRILIGCEFSGIVRDAFIARGHDAWSCDLLSTEVDGPHIEGNVLDHLYDGWDIGIFHPPCTFLTRAGDRWYRGSVERLEAALFVRALYAAPIHHIAVENPRGALLQLWRREDQVIQPWMFGHGETKATCLWLKNLPPLMATSLVEGREPRDELAAPGPDRWKVRSRTLAGIAEAMADQWGGAVQAAAA